MDQNEATKIHNEAAETARTTMLRGVPFEPLMQFFAYAHLPSHLQAVSSPFCDLANKVLELPRNPERTVALRKLLEAKDCAVRALIFKESA